MNKNPNTEQISGISALRGILVAACVLGIYTNVSISVGGGSRWYGVIAGVSGLALGARHFQRYPRLVASIIGFLGILATIIAFGPNPATQWVAKAKLGAQMLLSLVAALGLGLELISWPTELLRRGSLILAIGVGMLAILEVYAGLDVVSNLFREAVFGGEELFVYSSDSRDVQMHGGIRPKVFTQEPSHPARFCAVMLSMWFLLSKSRFKILIFTCVLSIMAFIMRSPTLILGVAVIAIAALGKAGVDAALPRRVLILITLLIVTCTVTIWTRLLPFERARAFSTGADTSNILRFVAPPQITYNVLMSRPLFGFGFGASEDASRVLLDVLSTYPNINLDLLEKRNGGWNNGFFQMVCFIGLLGSFLVLLWLKYFVAFIYPDDFATVLCIFFVVMNSDGGFAMVRPWMYIFLLLVSFQHRRFQELALTTDMDVRNGLSGRSCSVQECSTAC